MSELAVTNNNEVEIFALDLDEDLINHLALPESVGYLRAEQFTVDLIEDHRVKEIFVWQMEHYRTHGASAAPSVIEDQFEEVVLTDPQTAIGDLVERIRTRYMRNKGREIARNISIAVNEQPLDVAKLMMRGGRELADLTLKRGEVFGNGDIWRLMALYDKRVAKGRGPSLGYKELNEHFNGMDGVTFLIGPPKSCKSWATVKAVMDNIEGGGFPYAYSLELPANEYTMRLKHMKANIPYWKFLKGALMESERKRIQQASEQLDSEGCFKIEKPQPGERGVQRMVERALNAGATCVFIDQLQYVENRKGINLGSANNTGDYWEVCNDFRDYSDEIPIFVVHQFNRSVMKATEMPEAQQAKGSSAVEEVATLALGLWANREMRRSGLAELGTLASRNYAYESWELGVKLTYHCQLEMLGVIEDDDEE